MLSVAHKSKVGLAALSAVVLLSVFGSSAIAAFPEGGFLAILNDQRGNGDSPVSVMFYDVDNLNTPLFAVFIGQEYTAGAGTGWEESQAITVDPTSGDIYFNAFDSDGSGAETLDPFGDTQGDMDLYRIPFSTVYQHWSTNFEGQDVRSLTNDSIPDPDPMDPEDGNGWGPEPGWIGDGSIQNVGNPDYVTYSAREDFVDNGLTAGHANTYVLPSAVEKIGEVTRGNGCDEDGGCGEFNGPFWLDALEFVSETEIMLIGDSLSAHYIPPEGTENQDPADDHSLRMFRRVSESNGAATTSVGTLPSTTPYKDGGYNGGDGTTNSFGKPTESWESELIAFVGLDDPENGGHSEPESLAYHDNGANVRGVWVTERDASPLTPVGDNIAFMEIDGNGDAVGYRQIRLDAENVVLSMRMSNDPAVADDPFTFPGQIENIFVDEDTGDLIIVESGYQDEQIFIGGNATEPAVIRLEIDDYEGGEFSDEILLGDWGTKIFLDPVRDPSDLFDPDETPNSGDELPVRGQWSAYDSENDIVYFANPGHDTDDVVFGVDIYALDLNPLSGNFGMTTTYSNVDESYSLFLGDSYGDKLAFFNLEAPPGVVGDYNDDGVVDAADYTVWRDAQENGDMTLLNRDPLNTGLVDEDDYTSWRNNFGMVLGAGGGAASAPVPEPASLALLAMGLVGGLAMARRRRR